MLIAFPGELTFSSNELRSLFCGIIHCTRRYYLFSSPRVFLNSTNQLQPRTKLRRSSQSKWKYVRGWARISVSIVLMLMVAPPQGDNEIFTWNWEDIMNIGYLQLIFPLWTIVSDFSAGLWFLCEKLTQFRSIALRSLPENGQLNCLLPLFVLIVFFERWHSKDLKLQSPVKFRREMMGNQLSH